MKKVNFYVLATCALALTACGGMNKMAKMANEVQWDVTPKVLEMHGDSVEMEITVTFPPKYFQKAAILELTPVLKYEGGDKPSKAKLFKASQYRRTTKFARSQTAVLSKQNRKSHSKKQCVALS